MKNWVRIGWVAGIILIIASLIASLSRYLLGIDSQYSDVTIPLQLLLYFLPIWIYLGFMFAAKENNKKFLKIASLLLVIFSIALFVYYLIYIPFIHPYLFMVFPSFASLYFILDMLVAIILFLIIRILVILFGVSLIYSRKISKFAFITGIVILVDFVIFVMYYLFSIFSYYTFSFLFTLGIILLETLILIDIDKNSKKEIKSDKIRNKKRQK